MIPLPSLLKDTVGAQSAIPSAECWVLILPSNTNGDMPLDSRLGIGTILYANSLQFHFQTLLIPPGVQAHFFKIMKPQTVQFHFLKSPDAMECKFQFDIATTQRSIKARLQKLWWTSFYLNQNGKHNTIVIQLIFSIFTKLWYHCAVFLEVAIRGLSAACWAKHRGPTPPTNAN